MSLCSFCIVRPRMHPSPGGNVVRPVGMGVPIEIWVPHAGTHTSRMLQYGTHALPFVAFPTVMPTLMWPLWEASWAISHNLQKWFVSIVRISWACDFVQMSLQSNVPSKFCWDPLGLKNCWSWPLKVDYSSSYSEKKNRQVLIPLKNEIILIENCNDTVFEGSRRIFCQGYFLRLSFCIYMQKDALNAVLTSSS